MRIKDPESAAVLDRFRERVQTFVRALSTVPNDDDDEDGCAKGRASTPSSMCIMDLDEKHPEMSERLIRYLARSLAKLDKDVAEYVLSVSNADSEGVHETLAELRRELEPLVADGSMSGSAHTIASSRGDVSDSGDISEGEDSSRRRSFKKRLGKAIRDMRFFFRAPAVSDTNLSGAAPTADKGGSSWSLGGRSRNNFG